VAFSFGIEHEVAFLDPEGRFADFSRSSYADFDQIIEQLPLYPGDYDHLRRGDAGIKKKRWYIECFERFKDDDKVINCHPKGIEIRTTIHPTIQGVIAELSRSYDLLAETAQRLNYTPVCVAFNPYRTVFEPDPPLNEYERGVQHQSPEMFTQDISMLTYGPDLNLSIKGMTVEQLIDLGQKLTYYSPYLVPFSFNSPFYEGRLWPGLSARTFVRTGARPAVLVFVAEPEQLLKSNPSLTTLARLPAEVGRLEFKAFDACPDFWLYASLLAVLKGLALDHSRPGWTRLFSLRRPARPFAVYPKEEFIVPNREVTALVEALLLSPATLARFAPYRQPTTHLRELLVCTHGNRDICCGKFGFPAFHTLRQLAASMLTPFRVWRTSHFGGHRFAPTALDLPDGRCWGHLEAEVLENLARRSGRVFPLRPFYRGWSGLSVYEQVAEREIFMRQGWWWVNYLKDIQTLEFDEAENRAEIWLSYTTPDGRISGAYQATVAFSHQVSTLGRSGDRQPLPVKQYRVSRLEKVFEKNPAALKFINGRNKKQYELHRSES